MLRKLLVVICLVTFVPVAVGAQGVAAVAAPSPSSVGVATAPPAGEIDLSLPAASSRTLLAAADAPRSMGSDREPEQRSESRRSHSWDNFVDVHFGGYRWVWWAGAAAILIAIHAAAAD
jgi:hypothetical protein